MVNLFNTKNLKFIEKLNDDENLYYVVIDNFEMLCVIDSLGNVKKWDY